MTATVQEKRHRRRVGRTVALGFVLALSACGPAATPSSAPGGPASPVDGVVLSIDASSLTDVRGFTLRTATGEILTFTLGTLENPTQFAPGHLAEHRANAVPVRVWFVVSGGTLLVYRLEDAPRPSPS